MPARDWRELVDAYGVGIFLDPQKWKLIETPSRQYPHNVRTQAYELVALFSNLPHWVDMYEQVSVTLITKDIFTKVIICPVCMAENISPVYRVLFVSPLGP